MGIITTPGEPSWLTKARAQATVWNCDTAVLISPAIADLVSSIPRSPRYAINAGVVGLPDFDAISPAEISDIRRELGLQAADRLVLTIGRLDPTKYHHLFVEAAAQVLDRTSNVQFRIVGEGALANELLEQIQDGALSKQVRLLGRRTDISRLLAVANIYVRPGIDEGFVGITVLEAQAHQVPVVAFDTRDVRQAISDGVSGILIPTSDSGLLADAIQSLLHDSTMAENLGRAGHLHSETTFSITNVVDNLEIIYLETTVRIRA
jgi:glycosyltransferase involved in cell wall biosynthesis